MEHIPYKGCSCEKIEVTKTSKKMSVLNICSAVLFFLFPKCPACWAAYASLLSYFGLEHIGYSSVYKYIILGVFLFGSLFLLRKHYLKKSWLNIVIYSLGMVLLLLVYYLNVQATWWLYIVAFLMLLSNMPTSKFVSLFLNRK